MGQFINLVIAVWSVSLCLSLASAQLRQNYYANVCPNVENVVRNAVKQKFQQTFVTVPATLRLFFHDCFVQGCDASVIISSSGNNKAEKDHPDNMSLAGDGFDTVIKAKAAVDAIPSCRNKVSCADILAMATRDVVALSGGPSYAVELGRLDGLSSTAASVNGKLPQPGFNLNQLNSMFAAHSLSQTDMIALSGVSKIGFERGRRRIEGGFGKKMARSLEKCNGVMNVETSSNKLGVVRTATEAHAEEAIEALKDGKVIAVPTDTLYGFACDACSMEAVNRIYEIKGRKHTSPLAICVGDVSDIKRFAITDHLPHSLLDCLLPGPVTVVLRRGEASILEKSLNPGLDSIGVRVPDCNFIRIIAHGSGSALALTSANLSGQPSSVCIKDFENLWEHCAYVYDGGVLPSGCAGSTVVELIEPGKYKILRAGSAKEETVAILERHSLVEYDGTMTT